MQSRPNLSSSLRPARYPLSNPDQSRLGEATAEGLTRVAQTWTQFISRIPLINARSWFRKIDSECSPPQVQNFCKWKRKIELVWLSFCCSQYRLRVFTRCWLSASPLCKKIHCHATNLVGLRTSQGVYCRVVHSSGFVEWYFPNICLKLVREDLD